MKRSGDAIYPVTPVSYPPGPTAIKPTVVTLTPDVDSQSEPEPEPEPAKIISDLSLPGPQSTPQNLTVPSPEIEVDLSRSAKASSKAGNGKGYKYSEERRRRISEQVRQRWASGAMDHVHQKRMETLRRRGQLETPKKPKQHHARARSPFLKNLARSLQKGFDSMFEAHSERDRTSASSLTPSDVNMMDLDQTRHESDSDDDSEAAEWPSGTPEPMGDGEDMWSYLQPHLVVHKGPVIPSTGWVSHLLRLPRVRELDWNTPWLAMNPFKDSQPRDISALIIQMTGDPAPSACKRCRDLKGPFTSCIMISQNAPTEPLRTILGCANCYYHGTQNYCSHRTWSNERANEILSGRVGIAEMDTSTSSEDTGHDETPDEYDSSVNAFRGEAMESVTGGTAAVTPPSDSPAGFKEAEPGRPYNMWRDKHGNLQGLYGALLPAGYQLDKTVPGRPWVCPVRTCRKALRKPPDLGFHFVRVHFAALLHDNGDGTFSVKGVYKSKENNVGPGGKIWSPSPPVVVSREQAAYRNSSLSKVHYPSDSADTPESGVEKQTMPESEKDTIMKSSGDVWAYIRPFLKPKFPENQVPENPVLKQLLTLPRRRDPVMNNRPGKGGFHVGDIRDVIALAIQVTGVPVANACRYCAQQHGPFKGCIVLGSFAPAEARMRYPCCGNCAYQGKKSKCSLVTSRTEQYDLQDAGTADAGTSDAGRSASEVVDSHENHLGVAGTARNATNGSANRRAVLTRASSSFSSIPREDLLEMEEWEVAPGRIREVAVADAENIAFSKAYLSTNQVVPVCEDVSFHVDTVTSGQTLQLEADPDKMRICSVATGKVRVKIGEQPEFVMGPHGLFRVKPGTACSIRNQRYTDAVIHTTMLEGFM